MNKQELKELSELIQSTNINFLFGAGCSNPFLPLLGNVEMRLDNEKNEKGKISIYKEYFNDIMYPNIEILRKGRGLKGNRKKKFDEVFNNYSEFFKIVNLILLKRKSTLLTKQVNLFTTNIDIFMEVVLEENNIEYNDGFTGHFHPKFESANFKKNLYKRSLHYDNLSEIPLFNLIKIHGSLSWKKVLNTDDITLSRLSLLKDIKNSINGDSFLSEYSKLFIVNPGRQKFEETVMDLTYHDILRMFSYELEKENSVLFVIGFSMTDKHIREITLRCIDSNPTLKVFIFCYDEKTYNQMIKTFRNESNKYGNLVIKKPVDNKPTSKFNLKKITDHVFKKLNFDERSITNV